MKILIVTHYFYPHIGGIEKVAKDNADILSKKKHKITIISSQIGNNKKAKIVKNYRIIRVKASNFFEKYFHIPYPIFSPELILKLYTEIKKTNIVHIHDVFYISSIFAALLSMLLRKPYLITQHVAHVDHPNFVVNLLQNIIYKTIGTYILNRGRLVLTYNLNVTNFVANLGVSRDRIKELKHGVDKNIFYPVNKMIKKNLRKKYNLPINKKIILFVGRFVPKKGAQLVMQAKGSNYLILFAGNDNAANSYNSGEEVRLLGKLDQKNLSEIYQASDVFILPTKGEIFTLAMQEAMSSGLPIITTKDSKYDDYNINKKLIKFIEPTYKDIKKSINSIITNNKLSTEMSSYSISFSNNLFNLKNNANELVKLYRKINL